MYNILSGYILYKGLIIQTSVNKLVNRNSSSWVLRCPCPPQPSSWRHMEENIGGCGFQRWPPLDSHLSWYCSGTKAGVWACPEPELHKCSGTKSEKAPVDYKPSLLNVRGVTTKWLQGTEQWETAFWGVWHHHFETGPRYFLIIMGTVNLTSNISIIISIKISNSVAFWNRLNRDICVVGRIFHPTQTSGAAGGGVWGEGSLGQTPAACIYCVHLSGSLSWGNGAVVCASCF